MGVTGGLVKSIFFRNKSFEANDYNNGRSSLGDKKRWSSVRSFLCGDEYNLVLAVEDSGSIKDSDTLHTMSQRPSSCSVLPSDSVCANEDSASLKQRFDDEEEDSVSVKSSEATVTQTLLDSYVDNQSEATETHIPKKHQTTPISKLFLEEDAAVIIQSAFRSYLAIRRSKEVEKEFVSDESFSSDKVTMGTSVEVQSCNSVKAPFFKRKRLVANQRNNTQVLRIKEDWDDSTVSSTITKLRIQNRMEAMTKRERALAYAFSQQLRICSKKKQIDRNSEDESNIGWSWLERWMATRAPDNISVEPRTNIQTDIANKNQRLVTKNRSLGIAGELESCASNDLPFQFGSTSETVDDENEDLQTEKSGTKASISKRRPIPSNKNQRRHNRLQTTKREQQHTKKAKKAKITASSYKTGTKHVEAI